MRVDASAKGRMALDEPVVSVVIRAKDKARTIRDVIESVKRQTVPVEVIVVDSGSLDATPEIAREMGARIVSIPADTFTYGGAINTGIAASSADYVLVLSAHCPLPDNRWLEIALQHFCDSRVAGVNGAPNNPVRPNRSLSAEHRLTIGAMRDIVVQDRPFYGFVGFSNTAALLRRSVCTQLPFNEEMIYAEDKEWANRATEAGHVIVYDAALGVFNAHLKAESYRSWYQRNQMASRALTEVFGDRAWTLRKTAQHARLIFAGRTGVMRLSPFHPRNLVAYAGRMSGARRGRPRT